MNRLTLWTGVLSVSLAMVSLPLPSQAATLSANASALLNLDPTSREYRTAFKALKASYRRQTPAPGLAFEDWLAMQSFVNNEKAAYGSGGSKLDTLVPLDPALLTWEVGTRGLSVFFIDEGAHYRNQLGYAPLTPTEPGHAAMQAFWDTEVEVIWGDASSPNSTVPLPYGPLAVGQGAELNDVAPGETLHFFLRNGFGGQGEVFDALGAEATRNGDGLQHATLYQYQSFLVMAFEDLTGGGDRDYNDVVFAVRGLTDTEDPSAIPEPSSAISLLGLGLGLLVKRSPTSRL